VDKTTEFGRIYSEIANGYSKQIINSNVLYFKHPSLTEHFSVYSNYELLLKEARNKGVPTEEEKIKEAIEGGWWTKEKEMEISILRKTITNLTKTKNKLALPSQKEAIEKQLRSREAILLTFLKERQEITAYTAEDYTSQRFIDETILSLTYKNQNLTELYFTAEDYYNLNDRYIENIKNLYNQYAILFSSQNIKCIAACGFFQNLIYLNDDAYSFWGKPACQCTKYQIDILVYGKMYKNFIKNSAENGQAVQEDILNDPEKFVDFVEGATQSANKSKIQNKKSKDSRNMVSSLVGATSDDLKKLGVKTEKLAGGKSLLEMAKESGGTLEKHQYLKARESS
jgi:hypothetical protein